LAFSRLRGPALRVGRLEPVPVLALAALLALLLQPQMLFDLSFQLSYLALVGILTLTGPLSGRLLGRHEAAEAPTVPAGRLLHHSRLKWFVVTGCTASIAAQLPSLSLIASSFGSVPLLSPLVNLIAVPVSALLVPLGYLAGLLGLIAEPLAWLVNRLIVPVVGLLTSLARLSAKLPALTWAEVGWLGHFCWLVVMTAFVL